MYANISTLSIFHCGINYNTLNVGILTYTTEVRMRDKIKTHGIFENIINGRIC